jgi:hypothetical protein
MLRKIALFCSILPVFGASNAGLVASLAGTAMTGASTPVASLQWIADGAVVETGANSKLVVILLNGHRFELGAKARATVGPAKLWNTSGPVRELDPLPPMPKAAPLTVASDGGAAGRFRGAGKIQELCPRDGMIALPGSGKLSFRAVDGAVAYQIVLEDADGNEVAQQQTTATEIAVPLQPAMQYSWRIGALDKSGTVTAKDHANFATASEEQVKERKAFAEALGSNPALLAEVDFEAGLVREAIEEFTAAVHANPADTAAKRGLEIARSALAGK